MPRHGVPRGTRCRGVRGAAYTGSGRAGGLESLIQSKKSISDVWMGLKKERKMRVERGDGPMMRVEDAEGRERVDGPYSSCDFSPAMV